MDGTLGAPVPNTAPGVVYLEFGIKYRFIQETNRFPQISMYPQIVFPGIRSLGGGKPQLFLPIWLQKSFGRWTAFGGGGRWINPDPEHLDYWVDGFAKVLMSSSDMATSNHEMACSRFGANLC